MITLKNIASISFTSPKGGVGRTMTLANIAKIYADGVSWANIEKHSVLMIDLDFNAPGIHYYDFNKYSNDYLTQNSHNKNFEEKLKTNEIGLAFYLNKLLHYDNYREKCSEINSLFNDSKEEQAIKMFHDYLFDELFQIDEFSPLLHLIKIEEESIYLYPAGSPSNPNYSNIFFDFDWLEFLKFYFGDYLIKYLIEYTYLHIQKNENKRIRILLDQQAGTSIPASINRSLSDSNIYVTGFNKQNKDGLITLLNTYKNNYNTRLPIVILNQYDVRDSCFEISTSIISSKKSPHALFKQKDFERRKGFIDEICDIFHPTNSGFTNTINIKERIFITEFENEAIQAEYFYKNDCISYRGLVDAVIKIEKELGEESPKEIAPKPAKNAIKIKIIGENVQLIGEKNKFYGPFFAVLQLLNEFFQLRYSNVEIIGYAASHEQIADLAINGFIENVNVEEIRIDENLTIHSLIDYSGTRKISISDFNLFSFPYYLKDEDNLLKSTHSLKESDLLNIDTIDSLRGINKTYAEYNVIGWKDYSIVGDKIIGVPLFVVPQLLAYLNETVDKDSEFQASFHEKYLRHFNGFNDPLDLLNYAEITKDNSGIKKILLCSDEEIAKFYELQTISGIFNFEEKVNNIISKEKFFDYYFSKGAARAIKSYIELYRLSEKTTNKSITERDWDILLDEFFHKKYNSMIFLWADTIPLEYRKDEDFIYQLPPSFHYFEECWMLSAINIESEEMSEIIDFLVHFVRKETQQKLLEYGGLPVHKGVCSNIENWSEYPFLPHIWKSYEKSTGNIENETVLKRKSFKGYYYYGKQISNLLVQVLKQSDNKDLCEVVKLFRKNILDLMFNSKDNELQNHINVLVNRPENSFYKDYISNKNLEL